MLIARRQTFREQLWKFYDRYLEYYTDPHRIAAQSPREFFYEIIEKNDLTSMIYDDAIISLWPASIRIDLGRILFDLILKVVKVDENFQQPHETCSSPRLAPGFQKTFSSSVPPVDESTEVVEVHPMLSKLCRSCRAGELRVSCQ